MMIIQIVILHPHKMETPRQIRQRNRDITRKNVNKTNRLYNLRSTTANPIVEDEFLDYDYSDMDGVS